MDRELPCKAPTSETERERREAAVQYARASFALEGFQPSAEDGEEEQRFIAGEIDLVELMIVRRERTSSRVATAEQRQALESSFGSMRLLELRLDPARGRFDAAHLREINRRIFQDLPGLGCNDVAPGQYRPSVPAGRDWLKTRTYSTISIVSSVAYSRMDHSAQARLDELLKDVDSGVLSRLDTAGFIETIGTLYSALDYLHPFSDGNSRTLREFFRQLAEASGYQLDWQRFAQAPVGRDLLYIARDLSVNELALPNIVDKGTLRDVLLTQDQFEGNRTLADLLRDAVQSLPILAAD